MATLQFKRGAASGLPTLASGEPGWTTDTNELYVGTGAGNILIGPGGGYTDEEAQDAVGTILVDSNTVDFSYNDGTPSITADVRTQMSVTSDASGVKLSGDSATPGNSKLYGTDGSGVKGWYAQPATTYTDEEAQDAVGTILADSSTISFTYTDATPSITASIKAGSVSLPTHVSGILPDDMGGTGQSTYAQGDLLYASAADTLSKLAVGSAGKVLRSTGTVPEWGPTGEARFAVSSVAHGFAVGDWLVYDGTSGWTKARADNTLGYRNVLGVVTEVPSSGVFVLATAGGVTGLSGLTAGSVYYLDPTTAGTITATVPTGSTHYVVPVLVAYSTTAGVIVRHDIRPAAPVTGGSSLGSDYTFTSTSYGDSGLSITLPAAGTYLLLGTLNFRCQVSSGQGAIDVQLYNTTDSAAVSGSDRRAGACTGQDLANWSTSAAAWLVTVAASKTIRLEAKRVTLSSPVWVASTLAGTYTRLDYVKLVA